MSLFSSPSRLHTISRETEKKNINIKRDKVRGQKISKERGVDKLCVGGNSYLGSIVSCNLSPLDRGRGVGGGRDVNRAPLHHLLQNWMV